jgi:hypothetical protein
VYSRRSLDSLAAELGKSVIVMLQVGKVRGMRHFELVASYGQSTDRIITESTGLINQSRPTQEQRGI